MGGPSLEPSQHQAAKDLVCTQKSLRDWSKIRPQLGALAKKGARLMPLSALDINKQFPGQICGSYALMCFACLASCDRSPVFPWGCGEAVACSRVLRKGAGAEVPLVHSPFNKEEICFPPRPWAEDLAR